MQINTDNMKVFNIKHIIFRNNYKSRKIKHILTVFDTKDNVDKIVNKLNDKNKSRRPISPYDDPDWDDVSEDYIVAEEVK